MQSNNVLTDKNFWIEHSNDAEFQDLVNNGVSYFLKENVRKAQKPLSEAIELGCYPGNFMPTIARAGYKISGVDFQDNIINLKDWLKSGGYEVGIMECADMFSFVSQHHQEYDLVYSIGLIEHFKNWESVLQLHMQLVKPGGQLVITCPNYRSIFFRIYHAVWDGYSFKKHYLPAMQPRNWARIAKENGFMISYTDYFGGLYFWNEVKNANKIHKISSGFYIKFVTIIFKLLPIKFRMTFFFNCFCGLVATKNH